MIKYRVIWPKKCNNDISTIFWKSHDISITIYCQTIFSGLIRSHKFFTIQTACHLWWHWGENQRSGRREALRTGLNDFVYAGLNALVYTGLIALVYTGLNAFVYKGLNAFVYTGLNAFVFTGLNAFVYTGLHAFIFTWYMVIWYYRSGLLAP